MLGLDNFLTGAERNISHLAGNPEFEFRRQDVTVAFVYGGAFDYVTIHAAIASQPERLPGASD